jgi:hypothetical protein
MPLPAATGRSSLGEQNNERDSRPVSTSTTIRINIDVLNAEQQFYGAQRDLAKARYDTLFQGLKLKAAAGVLSETDVTTLNAMLDESAGFDAHPAEGLRTR